MVNPPPFRPTPPPPTLILALRVALAGLVAHRFSTSARLFPDDFAARRWFRSNLLELCILEPRLVPLAAVLAEVDASYAPGWLRPESVRRRLRELEQQVQVVVKGAR